MSLLRWFFYNLSYFRHPPWDTGVPPPELVQFVESHSTGRALDAGCGTGTNVIYLARHGWKVVGIDYALPAIRVARKKANQSEIDAEFIAGDITRMQRLNGPFDLILDMGCYHSLRPKDRLVYRTNLKHWLAPSGYFLLYGFIHPEAEDLSPGLSIEDFTAFARDFEITTRFDGSDRGLRASTWLTIRQKSEQL